MIEASLFLLCQFPSSVRSQLQALTLMRGNGSLIKMCAVTSVHSQSPESL